VKLILSSREQFDVIWNRSLPCNRMIGELGVPRVFYPGLNAYLVEETVVEIGSIVGITNTPPTLEEVQSCIAGKHYRKVQ
jgi:hypothetical protein